MNSAVNEFSTDLNAFTVIIYLQFSPSFLLRENSEML